MRERRTYTTRTPPSEINDGDREVVAAVSAAPCAQAPRRLRDGRFRAGEGKAHRRAAARRVEIDARGRGDPGLVQHAPAEGLAVVGEMTDLGIEVEGAVGRRQAVEAGLGQLLEEKGAVAGVFGAVRLKLLMRL